MGSSSATSFVDALEDLRVDAGAEEFHDKYDLRKCLGAGSFGAVYLARGRGSDSMCAVKLFPLGAESGGSFTLCAEGLRAALDEKAAWIAAGHHPNIVSLQEFYTDDQFVYFVMERCRCSLVFAWVSKSRMDEHCYAKYLFDMVTSVQHLHSQGVMHGDVKHANFLMGGQDNRTVKLCDFGLSVIASNRRSEVLVRGTAPYMSPEMVKGSVSGFASDIWSLGVIAYMCFFGCWPYKPGKWSPASMKKTFAMGATPEFRPTTEFENRMVSDVAQRFVRSLLNRDAERRPTAQGCLESDYLRDKGIRAKEATQYGSKRVNLLPLLQRAVQAGELVASQQTAARHKYNEVLAGMQGKARGRLATKSASSQDNSRMTAARPQRVTRRSSGQRQRRQSPKRSISRVGCSFLLLLWFLTGRQSDMWPQSFGESYPIKTQRTETHASYSQARLK